MCLITKWSSFSPGFTGHHAFRQFDPSSVGLTTAPADYSYPPKQSVGLILPRHGEYRWNIPECIFLRLSRCMTKTLEVDTLSSANSLRFRGFPCLLL
ncbi:hypothetical protein CI102_7770 [Trichoderma harzianum]|nr:hypothetical protein CI102_7770 [Trichoderma harzianum]